MKSPEAPPGPTLRPYRDGTAAQGSGPHGRGSPADRPPRGRGPATKIVAAAAAATLTASTGSPPVEAAEAGIVAYVGVALGVAAARRWRR